MFLHVLGKTPKAVWKQLRQKHDVFPPLVRQPSAGLLPSASLQGSIPGLVEFAHTWADRSLAAAEKRSFEEVCAVRPLPCTFWLLGPPDFPAPHSGVHSGILSASSLCGGGWAPSCPQPGKGGLAMAVSYPSGPLSTAQGPNATLVVYFVGWLDI